MSSSPQADCEIARAKADAIDIESGVRTVDEVRESRGLPPLPRDDDDTDCCDDTDTTELTATLVQTSSCNCVSHCCHSCHCHCQCTHVITYTYPYIWTQPTVTYYPYP